MRTTCNECWEQVACEPIMHDWVQLDEIPAFPIASGTKYDGLAKKLIYHLKYDNDRLIASDLALLLCKGLAALKTDIGDRPCLLVPVPLHWRRRWHRRFNQAELLAVRMLQQLGRRPEVAENMQMPILTCELLERTRPTAAHHQLSRDARQANIQGAFRSRKLPRHKLGRAYTLSDYCVIVLDDIYTSGATMSEAARTLLAAGAGKVVGLSVARAVLWSDLNDDLARQD